jgi:hypothetical protein
LLFLKEFEFSVVFKPPWGPIFVITILLPPGLYALPPGTLKSEECVNWPKLSVPDDIIACFYGFAPLLPARNYPALLESNELVRILEPYLVLPVLLIESKSFF